MRHERPPDRAVDEDKILVQPQCGVFLQHLPDSATVIAAIFSLDNPDIREK